MKISTHILYIIVIVSVLSVKYKEANKSEKYLKEVQKYRDMYNETMTDLSFCYSEMADETHKLTNSNRELYKLRTWIRECKPICRGEKQ